MRFGFHGKSQATFEYTESCLWIVRLSSRDQCLALYREIEAQYGYLATKNKDKGYSECTE